MPNTVKLHENEVNNTYGIEIEFGTHDKQILSFTHIEVCHIFARGLDRSGAPWKIETDADYTLELVSPILTFNNAEDARKYRNIVMSHLERWVSTGMSLGDLINELITDAIYDCFIYDPDTDLWHFSYIGECIKEFDVEYIASDTLYQALDWHNWDEDTDLAAVLAAKEYLEGGSKGKIDDPALKTLLENVFVTRSRKHGGLPSSQMNVPHTLKSYIHYASGKKRDKAWERLLEEKTDTSEYKKEKIENFFSLYPRLKHDKTWCEKYAHDDYIDSQVDEKTPIWHRYWLWQETIHVCASVLSKPECSWYKPNSLIPSSSPTGHITDDIFGMNTLDIAGFKKKLKSLKNANTHCRMDDWAVNYRYQISYIAIKKFICGALSELSEKFQAEAQQKLMRFKGELSMDTVLKGCATSEFLSFHYALKDLTPLWLKVPLEDICVAEKNHLNMCGELDREGILDGIFKKIENCDVDRVSELLEQVIEQNLGVLGEYHGMKEEANQGYDYDWDEFRQYNMPSIGTFVREFRKTLLDFKAYCRDDALYIAKISDLGEEGMPEFLTRTAKNTEEERLPIASWEGRWDTMKKPIISEGEAPRYLVEHRNN